MPDPFRDGSDGQRLPDSPVFDRYTERLNRRPAKRRADPGMA